MSDPYSPYYDSPNDPNPFNPNTSSSDTGGSSIPASSQMPDISMVWGSVPDFVPSTGNSSGSQGMWLLDCPPLMVNLASVHSMESTAFTQSQGVVDYYEDILKPLFLQDESWVYGQQSLNSGQVTNGNGSSTPVTYADPIQSQAQSFADGSNGQPGMNAVQEYALQAIGNVMGMVGEFMAAVVSIADGYATADSSSTFPAAS